CDGISCDVFPDSQLTKKQVNDSRKIITKAWIGTDGQTEYEMVIHFGKYSLRRYAKGTEMIDCIFDSDESDWMWIDIAKKRVEVKLK
ncbi:MAG: hypothetical protein ACKVTZ_02905, partial [Bacteroidia bacterium]